jgi:RNA polymerase sigma-70 factor (ECF subfamily)
MPSLEEAQQSSNADVVVAVHEARQGRVDALVGIMRQYNQRLFRIARSILRDDAEAEDVIQDAFIKAFTEIESLRQDDSIGAWLAQITVRLAISRGRQLKRRQQTFVPDVDGERASDRHDAETDDPNPERLAAMSDVRKLIEREIDRLPDGFREVFMARVVEQMSIEETAAALDVRPETVKTRLHRAKMMLRAGLEEHISAAALKAFPFGGMRCERTSRTVIERLRMVPPAPTETSQV